MRFQLLIAWAYAYASAMDIDGWADFALAGLPVADSASGELSDEETLPPERKKKDGRGRPVGTGGSHAFRAQLRAQKQVETDAQTIALAKAAQSQPQSGSIAYARTFNSKNQKHETQSQSQAAGAPSSTSGTAKSSATADLSLIGTLSMYGSEVQIALMETLNKYWKSKDSANANAADVNEPDVLVERCLFTDLKKRPTASMTAEAEAIGIDRQAFARGIKRVASSVVEGAGLMWGNMLAAMTKRAKMAGSIPLVFIKQMRYDETPTKLRLQDDCQSLSHLESQSRNDAPITQQKSRAKVLQSEIRLAAVIMDRAKSFMFCGRVPTWLQVMDRTTADVTKAAIKDLYSTIPDLQECSSQFAVKVQLSTTDRYSGNTRAEAALQRDDPSWIRLHLPCDIHKLSSAIGQQFELSELFISSMVNVALAMCEAGSVKDLQDCLMEVFSESLVIFLGDPPGGEILQHRLQIYELFLGVPKDPAPQLFNASMRLKRQKQRCILDQYLNHDLQTPIPVHWCRHGCCKLDDRADTLSNFKQYVLPALVPSACPLFPRGKWTRSELSIEWVGLFASHHNLYQDTFRLWLGRKGFCVQNSLESALNSNSGWDELIDTIAAPAMLPWTDGAQEENNDEQNAPPPEVHWKSKLYNIKL